MYRRKKRRHRNWKKTASTKEASFLTDVTVQESADSPTPVVAIRKKNLSKSSLLQKHAMDGLSDSLNEETVPLDEVENWYDRDLSEVDNYLDDNLEAEVGREHVPKEKGKIQSKNCKKPEDKHIGRDYPADLWYLLADYIAPEDIGCFSALCKKALHATNSASFWRKLYNRYCKHDSASLPNRLQPYSIRNSDDCIRAKVICALYRVYPPFQERIKKGVRPLEDGDSHGLYGAVCQFVCNVGRVGNHYYHFIKFRHISSVTEQNVRNSLVSSPSVWRNPSEGEILLRVACPLFQPFSSEHIMGLQLASISLSVSRDMCYNRLRLEFERNYDKKKRRDPKRNGIDMYLDPVIHVSVMDWWHPLFHDSFAQPVSSQRTLRTQTPVDNHWDA